MKQHGNRGLDDYVPVHRRVELFREKWPAGRVLTHIVTEDPLTVRAEVYFDDSSTLPHSTAHAREDGGMGNRKRSALEMTETAAVGRALALAGFEVKEGIASREEMEKAQQRPAVAQEPREEAVPNERQIKVELIKKFCARLNEHGAEPKWTGLYLRDYVNEKYGVTGGLNALSLEQLEDLQAELAVSLDERMALEEV